MEEINVDERLKMLKEEYAKLIKEEEEYEEIRAAIREREMFLRDLRNSEKRKQIEIAKKMLADKVDIETIMKYTELTKEEIENL